MIFLVRHGETAANRARLALGRADPPLTERGRVQADALAARLAASGARPGAEQPARRGRVPPPTPIAAALGVAVEEDPRLVELDYGEWDERSFSEFPPDDLGALAHRPVVRAAGRREPARRRRARRGAVRAS